MSITSSVPDESGIVVTAFGRTCFYCHEPTRDPAVLWVGSDGSIVLHAECVREWALPLGRDAHEILKPDYYARRFRRQ